MSNFFPLIFLTKIVKSETEENAEILMKFENLKREFAAFKMEKEKEIDELKKRHKEEISAKIAQIEKFQNSEAPHPFDNKILFSQFEIVHKSTKKTFHFFYEKILDLFAKMKKALCDLNLKKNLKNFFNFSAENFKTKIYDKIFPNSFSELLRENFEKIPKDIFPQKFPSKSFLDIFWSFFGFLNFLTFNVFERSKEIFSALFVVFKNYENLAVQNLNIFLGRCTFFDLPKELFGKIVFQTFLLCEIFAVSFVLFKFLNLLIVIVHAVLMVLHVLVTVLLSGLYSALRVVLFLTSFGLLGKLEKPRQNFAQNDFDAQDPLIDQVTKMKRKESYAKMASKK